MRYSFVLGIPAILGGCLVELKDLLEGTITVNVPAALIGFVVAVIVGILAIQLVRWLIRSDNFIVFSIYTLLVSIGTFAYCFIAARG